MQKIPLSYYQRPFWLDWKLNPKSSKYNTPLVYHLKGQLEIQALKQALYLLVNDHYHACKHYYIEHSSGEVEQQVKEMVEVSLVEEALGTETISSCINKLCNKPFDLIMSPLFKFYLIKINKNEHVLVLNFSHLITDAFSGAFIVKQINLLYNEAIHSGQRKEDNSSVRSHLNYKDYLLQETQFYNAADRKKDLIFWQKKLENRPLAVRLPSLKKRPKLSNNSGLHSKNISQYYFELDPLEFSALKKLIKLHGTTIFIALSALYAILLYRYTQQTDLCLSYTINIRPQEFREVPGNFINNIPWVIALDKDLTVRQLIHSLTEERRSIKPHQRCSSHEILYALKESGQCGPEEHFNVGIGEAFLSLEPLSLNNLIVSSLVMDLQEKESPFDLFLAYQVVLPDTKKSSEVVTAIKAEESSLKLRFDYRKDLFDEKFIEQLSQHFRVILDNFLKNPNEKIGEFPLLTTGELQKIPLANSPEKKEVLQHKTIHELFEEQVAQTPSQTACIYKGKHISYEVLNKQATDLAKVILNRLEKHQKQGRQPIVAIFMDRQIEMIIGMLAALKAGACFMPLDVTEAESRLQLQLKNSNPDVLLTNQRYSKRVSAFKQQEEIVYLDLGKTTSIGKEITEHSQIRVLKRGVAKDLAYIIHTSGSTGIPKGVMVEHLGLVNLIQEVKKKFNTGSEDKILNLTSVVFDVFILDVFHALLSGASFILCAPDVLKDPKQMAEHIQTFAPAIISSTPTIWSMITPYLKSKQNIRAISTGEVLPAGLIDKLSNIVQEIWNFYGPTEATVYTSCEKITPCIRSLSKKTTERSVLSEPKFYPYEIECSNIGKAFANIELYVLDEYLNPVPYGVTGELYIGGVGVARGYLNDPALTQEKFVRNIFRDKAQELMYKTGDKVRWNFEDKLEFLGRNDSQWKIRGFRVELGEIEAALLEHPDILNVAVKAEKIEADIRLIAYYVTQKPVEKIKTYLKFNFFKEESKLSAEKLSIFLKKRLPYYMQPVAFVPLNSMPMSASGKIDKSQLPKPTSKDFLIRKTTTRPYDISELKLKNIWIKIFNNPSLDFGTHDDFFLLGGHSFLVVELITQINEQFKIQLPVAWAYEHKTLRAQANYISKNIELKNIYNPILKFEPSSLKQVSSDLNIINCQNKNAVPTENIPLVFIHPALAGAEVYAELANLLGNAFPFYAIDSYNLNSGKEWITSIEALAAEYIKYLKTIRPNGPYLLGGWSSGGAVAFEMAKQLTEQGEKVKKVYLLDTCLYGQGPTEHFYEALTCVDLIDLLPEAWGNYLSGLPEKYLERIFKSYRNDVFMMMNYKLKPYQGATVLLKSSRLAKYKNLVSNWGESFIHFLHNGNGWKPWIKNLVVELVDSDHFHLMEGEAVKQVASILKKDILISRE